MAHAAENAMTVVSTDSTILDAFLRVHENNYGKPIKASGVSRTNVQRSAIWDQLANNSQQLMPQMQDSVQCVPGL